MDLGPVRLWLDDANPIFRRGLAACVADQGFEVVGQSEDLGTLGPPGGHPGRDLPGAGQPDLCHASILLFDATVRNLPRAVQLARSTGVRLVALITPPADLLVYQTIDAGAAAVLLRTELTPSALLGTLLAVASGQSTLPTAALPNLLERAAVAATGAGRSLSGRELAVLNLLAKGDDTREIAVSLGYAERTVKNIVHDMLVKMNCRNRVHAIAVATRQGLI